MINPVKAIEAISTAIDLDPDSQYYRFNRGVLKRKSADHQGDIEDFTKAFEIDPSFAEAVYEIGSIYFDIGDSEKACKNWKIGSELEHANSQILLNKHCNQSFNDYNKITE
jgi:tetratricopeptide (TPR) repeat protein